MIALAEGWVRRSFPLTGADVMKAGRPRGRWWARCCARCEDWWIDHDFIDDKMSAIEKLKSVVQGLAY
jgi:poly(A) polymerase